MSTSVLPQLLEVDSELSAQAIALEAKLSELQEKRKGIQTVISMFESGETPAAADVPAVTVAPTTTKTATKKTAIGTKTTGKRKATKSTVAKSAVAKSTAATSTAATSTAAASASAKSAKPKATRGRPSKAKTAAKAVTDTKTKATPKAKQEVAAPKKTVATKTAATKTAATKTTSKKKEDSKRSGRAADWQRYLQGTYKKSPLPDVIVGVLQAQPDNIFKIADVMNVVFKEDMPKSQFLKARNRISNILSAGARDGVWHRGRGGTYSMSEKAIKAG